MNRFEDRRSPKNVIADVRLLWAERPAPVHQLERDGWLVLVQAVGQAIETIEIRARGAGAQGRRSRLSREHAGGIDADVIDTSDWLEQVLPPGSRVLDRITHRDGDRRMTTVVATSASPVDRLAQGVITALARHGFAQPARGTTSFRGAGGVAQFLVRGSEELALTISEQEGQRALVMHWGRQCMTRRCRGQSLAEYAILLALIGLVLVIGEDSPLEVAVPCHPGLLRQVHLLPVHAMTSAPAGGAAPPIATPCCSSRRSPAAPLRCSRARATWPSNWRRSGRGSRRSRSRTRRRHRGTPRSGQGRCRQCADHGAATHPGGVRLRQRRASRSNSTVSTACGWRLPCVAASSWWRRRSSAARTWPSRIGSSRASAR